MSKYSLAVMERVRQNLDLEEDDESKDAEIEAMSHYEVSNRCLTWEGIIGWTPNIIRMVENIYGVELEN